MISVNFEYSNQAYLSVSLNSEQINYLAIEGAFLANFYTDPSWQIGKSSDSSYSGFIYQVAIYAGDSVQSSRLLEIISCLNPLNGFCIPDCGIDEFWIGPFYNDCEPCLPDCTGGCRGNDSCSLCADPLCEKCGDYQNGTCKKCSSGSYDIENCKCDEGKVIDYNLYRCTKCESNQYYNNIACINCPNSCESCTNSSLCLTCSENSHIENDLCICDLGYSFTSYCEAKWFTVNTSQISNSKINFSFSEKLLSELKSTNIAMLSKKCSISQFSIEKSNDYDYELIISYSGVIKSGALIELNLLNIYSESRSGLNETLFTFDLKSDEYTVYMKQAEYSGKVVSTSITATSISVSLVNPNPACLWSFINSIQMLCFIGLSTIDLPPKFFGYLKGLKAYNMFPNIFEYFITDSGGHEPYQRAYDFGYKNHLILKNIGNFISSFIFMLLLWLVTYLASRLTNRKPFSIKFIKEKIESSLLKYRYSALIRFWITAYLDFCAASLLGIIFTAGFDWINISDINK